MRRSIIAVGSLLFVIAVGSHAEDATPAAGKEESSLAKDLVGTWVLVGTPDEVGEPPAEGGRLKFFTGKHWTMTESDAVGGAVKFHHGGTYELDGDEYVESVKYANENTAPLVGRRFKFKLEIEGDTLTQTGIGNPYTEVWKRAK